MSRCRYEPSVADALADPLIQAIMAADAVHPAELRALMLETARRIDLGFEPRRPREQRPPRICTEAPGTR
jgi:hypothetical protein